MNSLFESAESKSIAKDLYQNSMGPNSRLKTPLFFLSSMIKKSMEFFSEFSRAQLKAQGYADPCWHWKKESRHTE